MVQAEIYKGQDPSTGYLEIPDSTAELKALTLLGIIEFPGYARLVTINYNYFGADTQTADKTYHPVALQKAASVNLQLAEVSDFCKHHR